MKRSNVTTWLQHIPVIVISLSWSVATAATVLLDFKDSVLVNDSTFTLGDIASVQCKDGASIETVVSFVAGYSAPPSFTRFIAPESLLPRLHAAFPGRQFVARGTVRTVVTTDFSTIDISIYYPAIGAYLDSVVAWPHGEWSATFSDNKTTVKILNAPAEFSVTGLENDRFPKGQTTLRANIRQGTRTIHVPLPLKITVRTTVLVASHDIARGQIVTNQDCTPEQIDITRFAPTPFKAVGQCDGKRAARTIRQGTILHDRLFQTIPLIDKEDPVVIVKKCKGITISIAAIAREPGGRGERIWVENSTTHKLVRVTVIAKGKVASTTGEV